jgi:hypothetical protein
MAWKVIALEAAASGTTADYRNINCQDVII